MCACFVYTLLLQVAAVRFLRSCLSDSVYNQYIIDRNLLQPVTTVLKTKFNTDCTLRSVILELLTYLRYVGCQLLDVTVSFEAAVQCILLLIAHEAC
jgi:hypothetical protein